MSLRRLLHFLSRIVPWRPFRSNFVHHTSDCGTSRFRMQELISVKACVLSNLRFRLSFTIDRYLLWYISAVD